MIRRFIIAGVAAATMAAIVATVTASPPQMFVTPLSGDEEVPARDTLARGSAVFQLNADGTELTYRLIASNINNVVQAHIHANAPAGVNTGVVVWLFPESGPPALVGPTGPQDGVLATGTITEDDLVGAFAGQPFSVLLDALRNGTAYVNVHTSDPTAPANTPGNFPGGEIRGQLD